MDAHWGAQCGRPWGECRVWMPVGDTAWAPLRGTEHGHMGRQGVGTHGKAECGHMGGEHGYT